MNDKLGIAAVAALLGAGLLTTKRFNKTMRAETFMAQAKRVNSIRENRINGYFSDYSRPLWSEYWLAVKGETAPIWWADIFTGLSEEQRGGKIRIYQMADYSYSYGRNPEAIKNYAEIIWEANRINERILSQKPEFIHANEVMKTATQAFYEALHKEEMENPDMTYALFARTSEGKEAAKIMQDAIQECNTTLGEEAYDFSERVWNVGLDKNAPKQDPVLVLCLNNRHPEYTISSYPAKRLMEEARMGIIVPASRLSRIQGRYQDSFCEPLFTKDDVERIKEEALENKLFGFYTQIVSFNEFFKRNPEIKSVGLTKNDQKYYSVDLNREIIPAGLKESNGGRGGGLVWDTEAFSSFTEAEGRDLTNEAIETAKKIIESAKKESERKQGQAANLEQQIETEQREYLIKKLTEGFAQYDSLDPEPKGNLICAYISLVVERPDVRNVFGSRVRWNWNFGMNEYPLVIQPRGEEPMVQKSYLNYTNVEMAVQSHNIDVSSLPVPASLRADAKAEFEREMNLRIQTAQKDLERAQEILDYYEKQKADELNRL